MEFIITGLFIIFFSYILLHSLYNILFKRSTIEGLDEKDDKKKDDKSKSDDASNLKKAQKAQSMASDANDQVAANNAKHKNATFDNANSLVKKPSNKITY